MHFQDKARRRADRYGGVGDVSDDFRNALKGATSGAPGGQRQTSGKVAIARSVYHNTSICGLDDRAINTLVAVDTVKRDAF